MELDAKRFTEGATLDTDICIVGAGPAGLVIANELVDRQCDVILLESGGNRAESEILALNVGDASGDVYAGLGATRHRQVGGTTHLWNSAARGSIGAKYAPLDAADFRARPAFEHSGWPFERSELETDYERAQRICGLGSFAYDADSWATPRAIPWTGVGPELVSRVYQFGARDALVAPLRASIARATNVRLCTHATATTFETNGSRRRISAVSIATPGGPKWSVRAKWIVLAAGAVEIARLLLVHNQRAGVTGDGTQWVGRGFMEHPRARSITLRPSSPAIIASAGFYDLHEAVGGTWIIGRLAISDAALASGELLNASATLFPRLNAKTERLRAMLPAFAGRWLPQGGHGWSTRRSAARDFDGIDVLLNLEQSPHPDNRITLSHRRDSLGVPLPALHWEWRAGDHARLERVRQLVVENLASIGVATIDGDSRPDPNAHHHAGTTRMHDDPKRGVTDRHGRVHASDNLYVAGASTFPTAGFANPVLTIVATALRLARHLGDAATGG
ncbi:MAG: GMC family oxidoreductase [Gemmatimonadota bacterium]|nr:GMC family oxidoreductase [Gemmatimonadota bacterium]